MFLTNPITSSFKSFIPMLKILEPVSISYSSNSKPFYCFVDFIKFLIFSTFLQISSLNSLDVSKLFSLQLIKTHNINDPATPAIWRLTTWSISSAAMLPSTCIVCKQIGFGLTNFGVWSKTYNYITFYLYSAVLPFVRLLDS